MKLISRRLIILTFFTAIINIACNQNKSSETEISKNLLLNADNETIALLDFIEKTGNYINSENIPALVLAKEVNGFAETYKLIDIRDSSEYKAGHIEGAINIQPKDIIDYLKFEISAVSYNKIVVICNTGIDASFVTSTLRLLGYGNVYAMKYGMSAWNNEYAEKYWKKNTSSKFVSQLITENNQKPEIGNYPIINTGKTIVYEILEEQARKILNSVEFKISADSLFSNLSNFFIVNYWPEFQYEKGHIPGAYQYTPRESLVKDSVLFTLPKDIPIVFYEYTGHHSAFIVAYLQILGYNAYAMEYGTNAIMYNQLIPKKIGRIFNKNAVNDFKVLKGMYETNEEKQIHDSISNK